MNPHIPEFRIGDERIFAPGVIGFSYRHEGTTYYPIVVAREPGSGDVGRWLDSLEGDVGFVEVISPQLEGMLVRRGFTKVMRPVGVGGEFVPVYHRAARRMDG